MSSPSRTVVVTWVDGKQEVYRCATVRVADGVLWLIQDRYPATDEPHRHFPLANLRTWTVDEP